MKHDSHGVNLFEISKEYGFSMDEVVDFSSNINPFGMSELAKENIIKNIDKFSTYPDPEYRSLKEAISSYVGVGDENILIGSGTSEIISNYISYINPKRALLISPCYSEYENELKKLGSEIFYYNLKEEMDFKIDILEIVNIIEGNGIELFIFANPNNPTGTILTREEVEYILKNTGINIFVDETYVEFSDTDVYSSKDLVEKYEKILVARSSSKFFATPGIRLGYALSKDEKLKDYFFKKCLIWGVNIAAELCGLSMFKDSEYEKKVHAFIKRERGYALEFLKKLDGIKVFESKGNFILCKILDGRNASDLYRFLAKDKMIIRDCTSFKNLSEKFFRFCLLGEEDNRKLLLKIKEFLEMRTN